jgi:actin-related protein 8
MINFDGKRGQGTFKFWNTSEDITDMLTTSYDEPTTAMRQLVQHLLPILPKIETEKDKEVAIEIGTETKPEPIETVDMLFADEESAPVSAPALDPAAAAVPVPEIAPVVEATAYDWSNVTFDIVQEASKSPLDGAIAAAIASAGTENKVKTASTSILLIGGTSALKGLGAFISERQASVPLVRLGDHS